MKIGILYYSFTGRNRRLSQMAAEKFNLQRIEIKEDKQRKIMTVAWELMFNKTPKVMPSADVMDDWDMVVFFSPVWMGTAATPIREYLKRVKKDKKKYALITLSGGADETNPNLAESVQKRAGHSAELILDIHVSDLMDKKMTNEEVQKYKMSDEDYKKAADIAFEALGKIL